MDERTVISTPASEIPPKLRRRRQGRWGPWRLDATTLVLRHEVERYEVDLERCLSAAQALDWICQIAGKDWDSATDDATIAGLVRALDDVLSLQSNLCGSGRSRTITRRKVAELVRR